MKLKNAAHATAQCGFSTRVETTVACAGAITPESVVEVKKMAQSLATKAPLAMRYILDAVGRGLDMPLADALDLEATLFGEVGTTDDMREGTSAFLEKRAAQFKGR